jgi:hypothetical protein
MTHFEPKQLIKKLQDGYILIDNDFFEISDYLSQNTWHCSDSISMMQKIILHNPESVAEILKIKKQHYTVQHYVTMAIITPHLLPDMPENLSIDSYSLPNENVIAVCKAVKNIQGWNEHVVDRVIDLVNRYDVPIKSTFTLLDSIYDSTLKTKQIMIICGWMYEKSKVISDDVTHIMQKWYGTFDISPWLDDTNYQIDVENRYIKFDKNEDILVLKRDMSRIREVALFLMSHKK